MASGTGSIVLWHNILDVNSTIDHITTTSQVYEVILVVYVKIDPLFEVVGTMIYLDVVIHVTIISVFPHIVKVEVVDWYEEPPSIMLWDITLSGALTLHITRMIRQYLLELAYPMANNDGDTFAFLELEYILQLHNRAAEPYQVHLLSYMKDPSNTLLNHIFN